MLSLMLPANGLPGASAKRSVTASILPLELHEAGFAVGERTILHSTTLRIEGGCRTVVLGANGAGKSVLLRLMHGLLTPTQGQITWAGAATRPSSQAMVFQRPIMLRRSAQANVNYALALARVPARERHARAQEALRRVGLQQFAQRPARVLSVGEQQRLALARAWALEPSVLFADEPTASLDPSATREIEAVIDSMQHAGAKIVMSTHSLGQARRLADEIIFLHRGRVVEQTPVEQFFRQPRTPEAAAFIKAELPWI